MNEIKLEEVLKTINSVGILKITGEMLNEDLADLGMDSILFIRMIVALEEEFECEIPDNKLVISEMNTLDEAIGRIPRVDDGGFTEITSFPDIGALQS